ncbi:MAG: hypothetical protein O7B26_08215 [Planctomycetota bacterium]|nr:hypothetical protein [Planctomycetota bacterium]
MMHQRGKQPLQSRRAMVSRSLHRPVDGPKLSWSKSFRDALEIIGEV